MNKQEAPEYEKVDPEECTHSGYFVPLGYEVFQDGDKSYIVVTGKMCIRCGKDFNEITILRLPAVAD